MIRLALLIPTLDRSGAEKQFSLLAGMLPRAEFQVEVIALTRGGPYEEYLRDQGIPVTRLDKRGKLDLSALKRLKLWLQEHQPDILHSWLFAANAYGRMAVGKGVRGQGTGGREAGVPNSPHRPKVIVSERCVDSWKSGWQFWLDRRLLSRTDLLLGNSQSVADFYRSAGVPQEKLEVVPNGVEIPPVPKQSRAEFLQELNIPSDAKLVGYVGRLAKQKRLEDLLWAAQVLRQADPRAYFLVIGDGPERRTLEEYSRQVESAAHVRFLGHRDDGSQLLHHLDLFWLASDFEGMSNSLMEAMACGKPVLASDIPPNRELVTHGKEGYLINVGDGVGYAQFSIRVFENETLAKSLGDAARLKMTEHFSLEQMVARHAKIYRRVLGKHD